MVELLGSYANRTILARLERLLAGQGRDRPSDRTIQSPRQRQRRLTSEQISGVLQRYQAGETVKALAEAFGVHRTTVVQHLKAAGVETRYRVLSDADLVEARELYEQGWSLARVGAHLGVDTGTVHNAVRRAGVTMRPVGTNQWSNTDQSR